MTDLDMLITDLSESPTLIIEEIKIEAIVFLYHIRFYFCSRMQDKRPETTENSNTNILLHFHPLKGKYKIISKVFCIS